MRAGVLEARLRDRAVERGGNGRGAVVAALLAAAEREPAADADGAAVPVQDSRVDAADAVGVLRAVAREHACREPVDSVREVRAVGGSGDDEEEERVVPPREVERPPGHRDVHVRGEARALVEHERGDDRDDRQPDHLPTA